MRTIRCLRILSLMPLMLSASLLPTGCTGSRPDDSRVSAAAARGAEVTKKLGGTLIGRLSDALAQGPPEDAVSVCSEVALRITSEISGEQGVEIRRTALRVRNPANRPDSWESTSMEGWIASPGDMGVVEELVSTESGWVLRQLRPIQAVELCVTCHGSRDAMSAELRTRIEDHYPEDAAVDFAPGDLRGAFSLRIPVD